MKSKGLKQTTTAITLAVLVSLIPKVYGHIKKPENLPPTIGGFINPLSLDSLLTKIKIFPGEYISPEFIYSSDPDSEKIKENFIDVKPLSCANENKDFLDKNLEIDGRDFTLHKPGNYVVSVVASDGENITKKDLEVEVMDPKSVLTKSELKMFNFIKDDDAILRYLGKISLLGYYAIAALPGAESTYDNGKVSPKGARSWFQHTPKAIAEIERKFTELHNWLIPALFNIEKLKKIKLTDYVEDLDKINPDDFGLNRTYLKRAEKETGYTLTRIMHVLLPQYLKLKHFFPDDMIDHSRLNEKAYSALIGTAKAVLDYLELTSLQAIRVETPNGPQIRYIYRPRSFFAGKEHLQAFDFNDSISAYNTGPDALKKKYAEEAIKKRWDPSKRFVKETDIHRTNFNHFYDQVSQLDKKMTGLSYVHKLINYRPRNKL